METNYYITFVLYAVYGKLALADQLLRLYRDEIYRAAERMRAQKGFTKVGKLYRGVVVNSEDVVDSVLRPQPEVQFLSFSESRDCAEWFADPRSIMNEHLAEQKPFARGYVIEHQPALEDVLFRWSWVHHRIDGVVSIAQAAVMHPQIDTLQFAWNNTTQDEVLVKPVGDLVVSPYSSHRTAELDERFTHPKFRK